MDDTDEIATPLGSSSLGDAVSAGGQSVPDDDDDDEDDGLYYIPERRPSLDLGPSPMDTSHWHYVEQALPPAQSYSSMTSEESSDRMEDEDGSFTRVQLNRTDSYSSCYSFDSDDCEKKTPKVKSSDDVTEPPDTPELIQDPDEFDRASLTVAFTFKTICDTLNKLPAGDLKRFKRMLWKHYPESFITPPQGMDMVDLVDRLLECYSLEVSLQITKTLLVEMGNKKIVEYLQTLCVRNEIRHSLCEILKKKYGEICEDSTTEGEKRPFDDFFINPCITARSDYGPNIEHEVMTIEKLNTHRDPEKLLSTKDIFSTERMQQSNSKLVFLAGVAGSGKSMAVRRLILDWVEGRSHQHVTYLFPLPFRELKQFEGVEISLLGIVQKLYPAAQKLTLDDLRCDDCRVMFIFDGLDEYYQKLDFQNTELYGTYTTPTTMDVIAVNLLRGRLLFRSLFLVAARSQVKNSVPWDTFYNEIQIHGFRDPEKVEYFKKRFKDPDQAARVIAYVSSLKTLHILCHLPLFCSLVADECQRIFQEQGTQAELPRSITYMYTKLLLALVRQHRTFRAPDQSPDTERDFLMKLGKLAFTMLEQGEFKIAKADWGALEISEEEAVDHSGLCTQFLIKPHILFREKVLSFIHPTMQEYLAALYALLYFTNQGKNIFEQQLKDKVKGLFKGHKVLELYKSAVDRSLLCEDGKWDIFVRFLCGMARKTNQELLQHLSTSSLKWSTVADDAAALIRKRIRDNQHPKRTSNLQLCLEELGV